MLSSHVFFGCCQRQQSHTRSVGNPFCTDRMGIPPGLGQEGYPSYLYILSAFTWIIGNIPTPGQWEGGGEGCHLRVVPPGQLLRRPSTPKPFTEPGFSIFLTWSFFVLAFWWLRVFHWGCYVYFRIVFGSNSLYILYIFIFIYFIYFFIVLIVDLLIIPLRFVFLCVCGGFSLASWCWTGCPKETIAI